MKKKIYLLIFLFFIILGFITSFSLSSPHYNLRQQNVQDQENDYMSNILSRNTEPLGLKENPLLKKYLDQPGIKWAIRATKKSLLN